MASSAVVRIQFRAFQTVHALEARETPSMSAITTHKEALCRRIPLRAGNDDVGGAEEFGWLEGGGARHPSRE